MTNRATYKHFENVGSPLVGDHPEKGRAQIGKARWLLVFCLLATALTVKAGDFTWTTNSDNTLTITGYTGPGGAVVIPSAIEGRTVTSIGEFAFGTGSWRYSETNLISVTIPDSVTNIEQAAFENCQNLTNVMIGNGVINIKEGAFYNCWSLTALTVDAENHVYSSVDGVLFNKNRTKLLEYPLGKTGSYTIPDGVTSIEPGAFGAGYSQFIWGALTSVIIPDSVTNIGDEAFSGCCGLTSVSIGNGVLNIGNSAFHSTDLTSIMIPSSVTRMGNWVFDSCWQLMGVYFMGNAPSIGTNVFDDIADNTTIYYLPGESGWGPTFGGRPARQWQWWDGPQITANGVRRAVSLNKGDTVKIAVTMNTGDYTSAPVDWWVIIDAGFYWYYLNNLGQWTQVDGGFENCYPVYQGGLFNLPTTELLALNTSGLEAGSYTFWFAVDYPMDRILNAGGYILIDSVSVTVRQETGGKI
jgi:hypothetical protein